MRSRNGFRGRECRACRGQGRGGRVRWGWTSGLGGVGGRGKHARSVYVGWRLPDKKTDFEFFWGRGRGPWSGRDGLDFGLGRSRG